MAFLISERLISERLEGLRSTGLPFPNPLLPATGCSVLYFSLAYRVAVDLGASFFNVFGYSITSDKESRLYCVSVFGMEQR